MNDNPAASRADRLAAEIIRHQRHHHRCIGQVVACLKGGDDREHGGGLGVIALEAADLQREPGAVRQQPDDDLRIQTPLFRIMPTSA